MTSTLATALLRQFDTATHLLHYHLDGLTTEECLWRPTPTGPHVHRMPDGRWRADWPEREDHAAGAPSIAWLSWHIGFWWSMVLDRSFGDGLLERDAIDWPGTAEATIEWIGTLEARWCAALSGLGEEDLHSPTRTHWPFADRPFADIVAWVTLELVKNGAEIGYARFLYAGRSPAQFSQ